MTLELESTTPVSNFDCEKDVTVLSTYTSPFKVLVSDVNLHHYSEGLGKGGGDGAGGESGAGDGGGGVRRCRLTPPSG